MTCQKQECEGKMSGMAWRLYCPLYLRIHVVLVQCSCPVLPAAQSSAFIVITAIHICFHIYEHAYVFVLSVFFCSNECIRIQPFIFNFHLGLSHSDAVFDIFFQYMNNLGSISIDHIYV